ncbi:MAG: hypothetical protein KAQ90_12130 [Melioribacteraceae bacterium]|nr:hypothetical protein [Melioribacteraceae bacterium]
MSQFETAGDFINIVTKFHHQLADYYKKMGDSANKEIVKILLSYIREHEMKMEASLIDYEKGLPDKIKDTWFEFVDKEKITKCFSSIKFYPEMTVDDIIEMTIKFDDCIIELYKNLVESSEVEAVKEVFRNLLEMEIHEKMKIVKSAMRIREL